MTLQVLSATAGVADCC